MSKEKGKQQNSELKVLRVEGRINPFAIQQLYYLLNMRLDKLFEITKKYAEKNGGADQVITRIPLVGETAIAITAAAAKEVLEQPNVYTMPSAAHIQRELLGIGPLTEGPGSIGARAVTEFFGVKRLKSKNFVDRMYFDINQIISEIKKGNTYDEASLKLSINYIKELFFSNSLGDKDMQVVFDYVSLFFANLVRLMGVEPVKIMFNLKWETLMSKELILLREKAESILIKSIGQREKIKEQGTQNSEHKDLLDTILAQVSENQKPEQRNRELLGNILQLVFASIETTSSGTGACIYELVNKPELQEKLRTHALNYFKTHKQVQYEDLSGKDPDMLEILKFVAHSITAHAPAPIDARETKVDSKITAHMVSLQHTTEDQFSNGHTVNGLRDAITLYVFGGGEKRCKGASFAIYKMVATVAELLRATNSISMRDDAKVTRVVNATSYWRGMKFKTT